MEIISSTYFYKLSCVSPIPTGKGRKCSQKSILTGSMPRISVSSADTYPRYNNDITSGGKCNYAILPISVCRFWRFQQKYAPEVFFPGHILGFVSFLRKHYLRNLTVCKLSQPRGKRIIPARRLFLACYQVRWKHPRWEFRHWSFLRYRFSWHPYWRYLRCRLPWYLYSVASGFAFP